MSEKKISNTNGKVVRPSSGHTKTSTTFEKRGKIVVSERVPRAIKGPGRGGGNQ